MKKQIDVGTQSVTFTFDGGLAPITIHMKDVSPACATHAMLHGFSARIGDNAALSRKDSEGKVVTITEAMRREAVAELVGHYTSGSTDWSVRTSAVPKQNAAIAALASKLGKTYAEAEAHVANMALDDLA